MFCLQRRFWFSIHNDVQSTANKSSLLYIFGWRDGNLEDGLLRELANTLLSFNCMNNKNIGSIHPETSIGHVHLKVADLERSLQFYHGVLGFDITHRIGNSAAFLSAGGYHHHLGLNTWESKNGQQPEPGSTGLYHTAILYPTRAALADALRRLIAAGIPLDGASDHGVSEALYLHDPDGNGVELYRDRPQEQWPRDAQGEVTMYTRPLDLAALLSE